MADKTDMQLVDDIYRTADNTLVICWHRDTDTVKS